MTVKSNLLDETQAAKWLNVSISTLRRERQRGRLPFYRIGGWRVCYSIEQLQGYLENYCAPMPKPNKKPEQSAAA